MSATAESAASVLAQTLRITEIFLSLQGESTSVGLPTVFVRTTGCPLRCQYCDTAYAFSGGVSKTLADILGDIADYGVRRVTVTGGEPLAQGNTLVLMQLLCDQDYAVSLETSGAIDVSAVDPRVMKVVDIKTPGSAEAERNLLTNLHHLSGDDQLKFVICDRDDYDWSVAFIKQHNPNAEVLFSPSHGQVKARELADWIVSDRLDVRFQTQLHKALWGDEPGR